MPSSYFNEDQQDYMRSLAKMKPEEKCWCGWYRIGQCYGGCNESHPSKTAADRIASERAALTPGGGK